MPTSSRVSSLSSSLPSVNNEKEEEIKKIIKKKSKTTATTTIISSSSSSSSSSSLLLYERIQVHVTFPTIEIAIQELNSNQFLKKLIVCKTKPTAISTKIQNGASLIQINQTNVQGWYYNDVQQHLQQMMSIMIVNNNNNNKNNKDYITTTATTTEEGQGKQQQQQINCIFSQFVEKQRLEDEGFINTTTTTSSSSASRSTTISSSASSIPPKGCRPKKKNHNSNSTTTTAQPPDADPTRRDQINNNNRSCNSSSSSNEEEACISSGDGDGFIITTSDSAAPSDDPSSLLLLKRSSRQQQQIEEKNQRDDDKDERSSSSNNNNKEEEEEEAGGGLSTSTAPEDPSASLLFLNRSHRQQTAEEKHNDDDKDKRSSSSSKEEEAGDGLIITSAAPEDRSSSLLLKNSSHQQQQQTEEKHDDDKEMSCDYFSEEEPATTSKVSPPPPPPADQQQGITANKESNVSVHHNEHGPPDPSSSSLLNRCHQQQTEEQHDKDIVCDYSEEPATRSKASPPEQDTANKASNVSVQHKGPPYPSSSLLNLSHQRQTEVQHDKDMCCDYSEEPATSKASPPHKDQQQDTANKECDVSVHHVHGPHVAVVVASPADETARIENPSENSNDGTENNKDNEDVDASSLLSIENTNNNTTTTAAAAAAAAAATTTTIMEQNTENRAVSQQPRKKSCKIVAVPPGKLGITLTKFDQLEGARISRIDRQGVVFKHDINLNVGDQLVAVDSVDVTNMSIKEILSLLASIIDKEERRLMAITSTRGKQQRQRKSPPNNKRKERRLTAITSTRGKQQRQRKSSPNNKRKKKWTAEDIIIELQRQRKEEQAREVKLARLEGKFGGSDHDGDDDKEVVGDPTCSRPAKVLATPPIIQKETTGLTAVDVIMEDPTKKNSVADIPTGIVQYLLRKSREWNKKGIHPIEAFLISISMRKKSTKGFLRIMQAEEVGRKNSEKLNEVEWNECLDMVDCLDDRTYHHKSNSINNQNGNGSVIRQLGEAWGVSIRQIHYKQNQRRMGLPLELFPLYVRSLELFDALPDGAIPLPSKNYYNKHNRRSLMDNFIDSKGDNLYPIVGGRPNNAQQRMKTQSIQSLIDEIGNIKRWKFYTFNWDPINPNWIEVPQNELPVIVTNWVKRRKEHKDRIQKKAQEQKRPYSYILNKCQGPYSKNKDRIQKNAKEQKRPYSYILNKCQGPYSNALTTATTMTNNIAGMMTSAEQQQKMPYSYILNKCQGP